MLLDAAAESVRQHTDTNGLDAAWDIFDRRLLQPMRSGAVPVSTEEFMKRWSLSSQSQVANVLVRMKRKFTAALMHELGLCGDDPDTVHREVCSLLEALERGSQ